MPSPSPELFPQYLDNNAHALAGGSLLFYAANTTTKKDTYADAAGVTINANPLTLDSGGRAIFFLGVGAYDITLKDVNGVQIATALSITAVGGSALSLQIVPSLTAMRALASGSSTYTWLAGSSTNGDGYNRQYYWSSTSAVADDGLTVIRPASNPATGRWLILEDAQIVATALGRLTPNAGAAGLNWSQSSVAPTSCSIAGANRVIITSTIAAPQYVTLTNPQDGQEIVISNQSTTANIGVTNGPLIPARSDRVLMWDATSGVWISRVQRGQGTVTLSGMTLTTIQSSFDWGIINSTVKVNFNGGSGTSNATTFGLTGLPSFLVPSGFGAFSSTGEFILAVVTDNGNTYFAQANPVPGSSTILLSIKTTISNAFNASGFTNSGTKGLPAQSWVWSL